MQEKVIRSGLYLLLLFGLLSACLPIGKERVVAEATETIQPQFTPLPHFTRESISPGTMQAYSFLSSSGQEMDYLLYLPDNYYERPAWPLILSLHGNKPTRISVDDVLNKMNPLNALEPDSEFPFILVAPVSPAAIWKFYFQPMDELLDTLVESLSIDSDALILTGFSVGAYGGWHYALLDPGQFVAFVPVAGGPGGGPVPENICLLKDLPIWIIHSDADFVIPIKESYAVLEALEKCGSSSIHMTTYTDLDHVDSIYAAYGDPALYEWMLKQTK
jgi:predicted peptidase